MINFKAIECKLSGLKRNKPFSHGFIDNFLNLNIAKVLEYQFLKYEDQSWFIYNNPLEHKKALNDGMNFYH